MRGALVDEINFEFITNEWQMLCKINIFSIAN